MARARNIKPGIVLNDALAALAHWVRLLFVYLWTLADKAGRLVDNPRRIGAALFPYEPALPIDEGLQQLHDAGFIRRYAVGGVRLIQIVNWEKHQNPHFQEKPSELPPCPTDGTSVAVPSELGTTSDVPPNDLASPSEPLRIPGRSSSPEVPSSNVSTAISGDGVGCKADRTRNRSASGNLRTTSEPIHLIPDPGYLIPDSGGESSGTPTPPHPQASNEHLPDDTDARIRLLADKYPSSEGYEQGCQALMQFLVSAVHPVRLLETFEHNAPLWIEAIRAGNARLKSWHWFVRDRDWERVPKIPVAMISKPVPEPEEPAWMAEPEHERTPEQQAQLDAEARRLTEEIRLRRAEAKRK